MNISTITSVNNIIINKKLVDVKSSDIFPKHKGYFVFVRIICFELIYFCSINK